MTTPAQFDANLAAALVAIPSVGLVRCTSDYSDEWDWIPPGANRFQIRMTPVGFTKDDSNAPNGGHLVVVADFTILHRLGADLDERAVTLGDYLTVRTALVPLSFWRAIAGAHDGIVPRIDEEAERVGHVIRWGGSVELQLTP